MPSFLDRLKKTVTNLPGTVKKTADNVVKDPVGSAKSTGKFVLTPFRFGLRKLEDGLIWYTKDSNKPKDGSKDPAKDAGGQTPGPGVKDPNKDPAKAPGSAKQYIGWGMVAFAMVTPFTAPIGIAGGYIIAKGSPETQKKLAGLRKKAPMPFNGMIAVTRWIMPRIANEMDKMTDPKTHDKPPAPPANDAAAKDDAKTDKPDAPKSAGTQAAKGFSFRAFDPRNYLPRGLGGRKRLPEVQASVGHGAENKGDTPKADRRHAMNRMPPRPVNRPKQVRLPRL
ncbi:MAG: hypothetical protein Alpg2KO_23360 [Alphaproteobacteria bacterium]